MVEAGDEEHGGEDQLRQLGEHLAARQVGDGAHQERALDQARGRGRWSPASSRPRTAITTRPDGSIGGRRNRVGAVAVVFDARVGRQAAHAAEQDRRPRTPRRRCPPCPGSGRGRPARPRRAGGSQLDGAPEPRERLRRDRRAVPIPWGPARSLHAGVVESGRAHAGSSPKRCFHVPAMESASSGPGRSAARPRTPRRARGQDRRGQDPGEGVTTRHAACSANSSTSARSCTRRAGGRLSRKRRP